MVMTTPSFRVGILGATGAVGQKFITLLENHPWFTITALAASERSAGKRYADAVRWTGEGLIPQAVRDLIVQPCEPNLECDFVFSGLDSSVAGEVEGAYASAGYPVISNARNYRMHPTVPLLIPEVNPDHVALIPLQKPTFGPGFIVTNPNCSTVGLVCALKPIHNAFGVKEVLVSTMQAISGAGYPGIPSLDILGNVVPYIGGEEEKLEIEPPKLLGTLSATGIDPAPITTSAHCNRVPVIDGHTACVSVSLNTPASPEEVSAVLRSFPLPEDVVGLPSAPDALIEVHTAPDAPQPRRHVSLGGGQKVSVGRVRTCNLLDLRFVVLSHNTVRGAAGGALLNAELLVRRGYIR